MKRIIEKALAGIILCLPFVFLLSCKKPTEPDATPGFSISVEDVSCIEAWVRVKSEGLKLPATISITKNDTPVLTFTMTSTDTVVMIDSLQPKQTYAFRAFRSNNARAPATANCVTLDTTSHNFTWQTFTFGEHSSSLLYDVAIIDENNIWAVGEIYLIDSLGRQDPQLYNLMKWNGISWKPERVYFTNSKGQSFLAPMQSIYVINAEDIWIGQDQIIRWDGKKYICMEISKSLFSSWINKLWGTSSNNMYVVGDNGSIAHWSGSNWVKIVSGMQIPLTGITGTLNGERMWVSGWNYSNGMTTLLELSNNTVKKLFEHNISNSPNPFNSYITGVWYDGTSECWMTGADGVVKYPALYSGPVRYQQFPVTYFPRSISGDGKNNVVIGCDGAMIWHFNGISWKPYPELVRSDCILKTIKMRNKTVIAVGFQAISVFVQAVILIGKQN